MQERKFERDCRRCGVDPISCDIGPDGMADSCELDLIKSVLWSCTDDVCVTSEAK